MTIDSVDNVQIVKAKTIHIIMNSAIMKQIRKALSIMNNRHHWEIVSILSTRALLPRRPSAFKWQKHSIDWSCRAEGKQKKRSSLHLPSPPSSALHSSPVQGPRGWFTSGFSIALPGPYSSTVSPGSGLRTETFQINEASLDQDPLWSLILEVLPFRPTRKPRSPPVELIYAQATEMTEEPSIF